FISYGGSSLLTNMVALGLVLSVKIHQGPFE
ncbi:FtsW/RodA/SpoVE family cell cycle protein, partial [Paenibacillus sp. A3]